MSWSKGDKVVELRQGRRREIVLGDSLAFGGAGEVFAVEGSGGICAKMLDAPTAARQGKIRELMAKHDQGRVRDSDAAWPRGLVVAGPDDSVVGYTMDKVRGRSLSELAVDPSVDFGSRVRCALSLCEVVARLHGTQQVAAEDRIVVGDLDLANAILDSRTGQAKLIDTDGMQVVSASGGSRLAYPTCELRACSPETLDKRTGTYLLTSRHDWFLLAICVSRLLMPGDPLYSEPAPGADPRDERERVVRQRLWPYEGHCHEWGLPAPAEVVGVELADLLHRSFTAPWDQIPSTAAYVAALNRLAEKGAHTCKACGSSWSAAGASSCPFCEDGAARVPGGVAPVAATRVQVAPATVSAAAGGAAGGTGGAGGTTAAYAARDEKDARERHLAVIAACAVVLALVVSVIWGRGVIW